MIDVSQMCGAFNGGYTTVFPHFSLLATLPLSFSSAPAVTTIPKRLSLLLSIVMTTIQYNTTHKRTFLPSAASREFVTATTGHERWPVACTRQPRYDGRTERGAHLSAGTSPCATCPHRTREGCINSSCTRTGAAHNIMNYVENTTLRKSSWVHDASVYLY